jgi:hypothetical protein
MPEQDAAIAITAQLGNMQQPLDLVWDNLLPAMKPSPLPANADALAKLKNASLTLEVKK